MHSLKAHLCGGNHKAQFGQANGLVRILWKKELWTRFEAASSYGFHYNAPTFQKASKEGFLDMLEEAFCDGESLVLDVSGSLTLFVLFVSVFVHTS